jgi:hypothetical protein
MNYDDIMHMAIDKRVYEQRLIDEMMRTKTREFEDALADSIVYGTGVMQKPDRRVQMDEKPQYSMAEIVLMDGTTQTFMMKASTSIIGHLTKEMKEKGFLTMWNDTDVLCIRADQVKQFALRAFTQQEK